MNSRGQEIEVTILNLKTAFWQSFFTTDRNVFLNEQLNLIVIYCKMNMRSEFMNRLKKVYLDTSVVSYLDQQDALDKMRLTRKLWDIFKLGAYEVVISDKLIQEIEECKEEKKETLYYYLNLINYELVYTDENVDILSNEIINEGILSKRSKDDAIHIALAILNDCDYIISWNFKHLVNVDTINGVRKITFAKYNKFIDIYAPINLLKGDESDGETNF